MMPTGHDGHPSFVVALPMYNEEANAKKCVQAISHVLDGISLPTAIVAVNDGSRDNTLPILESLRPQHKRLDIVDHRVNSGYGAAIKSAYRYGIELEYDYVLFMDADLTQDPQYIRDFVPYMIKGIDIIKASRYIQGSGVNGVPRFRVVISSLGNRFARLTFHLPITDYTNGFRAVKTAIAKQFQLKENHFAVLVEEMWQAKYLAKTYAEIHYMLNTRANAKDSKFKYNFDIYRHYLKYCFLSFLHISPKFESVHEDGQA